MAELLMGIGIAAIAVLLVGSFFFSLAEAALLGVSGPRLRRMQDGADPRGHVVAYLVHDSNYLSVLIVGMNLCNILIATIMTLIVHYRVSEGSPWLVEGLHLAMVGFIIVFAEITPKSYGARHPESTALAVARPLQMFMRLFHPITVVLNALAMPLIRILGRSSSERQMVSLEELRAAADESEEDGLVNPDEGQMLDNVIDLSNRLVREIMVPRVDMLAVGQDVDIREFAVTASRSGYSRIPIYEENLDNITGIVYVKDVLDRLHRGETDFTLQEIARTPMYVPETKWVDKLFLELREQRVHIAIVVDEYGGTAGLVTIEDILEELVGEIVDEHDPSEEEVVRVSDNEYMVDGKARIEDVNELLADALPNETYETIGGLVSGLAGHIPETGERFELASVQFVVEESDGQHVERVRIVVDKREEDDN